MTRSSKHPQRGFLLVPVLFVVLLLGGLSAALLTEGLGDRTSIRHRETSMKALELAEAGIHRAQLEIFSLTDLDVPANGVGNVSGQLGGGTYEVICQQDATFPDRWTATARGEHGLSVRRIEIGVRRRAQGFFVEGLFSRLGLDLFGDIQTDSYNSNIGDGTWTSQATNFDAFGAYANTNGHVGSNEGIVNGGSASVVRGNAIPGPGFETEMKGSPTILGDRVPRRVEIDLPAPPLVDFQAAYDNMRANAASMLEGPPVDPNVKPKGKPQTGLSSLGYDEKSMALTPKGDVILTGGDYFFTELKLAAQAKLIIRGPSRIYVTGAIDLTGGGVVNEPGVPGSCQIFAHPHPLPAGYKPFKPGVKISGGAKVAAAVYAPYLDVSISGNGDLFGAVVGETIDVVGTASFHYDEALGAVQGGATVTLERLYWRELSPAPR